MYPDRHVESVGGGVMSSNDAPGVGAPSRDRAGAGAVGLAQAAAERMASADSTRRVGRDIAVLL